MPRHGLRFFGHLLLGLRRVGAVGAQKLGAGRPIIPQTSAQKMHTIQQLMPSEHSSSAENQRI